MGNAFNVLLLLLVPGFIFWAYSIGYAPPSTDVDENGTKLCYYEYADAKIPPPNPRRVDKFGLPMSWHSHIEVFLNSSQLSPAVLSEDIRKMPDLSGAFGIPNLRTAMEDDRSDGSGRLVSAVMRLNSRNREDLFVAGEEVRNQIKEILFLWFGVADIDPSSRGWFIDARMLAFPEKLGGEKFVQSEWFPNPMPMAATALKDIFSNVLDRYYAKLVNQLLGNDFFASRVKSDEKPETVIRPEALRQLTKKAATLQGDGLKKQYWCNVVKAGASVADLAPGLLRRLSPAQKMLDDAIRQSSPTLSLSSVSACVEDKNHKIGDWIWLYGHNRNWRDRLDRKILFFDILITVYKAEKRGHRHICYIYAEP